MKKIAFINQRYGLEVNGGSEYYTRIMAEHFSRQYQVEVLTTKAIDYITWKNHYKQDSEIINGVVVRRFTVDSPRKIRRTEQTIPGYEEEYKMLAQRGPYCPKLIKYIKENEQEYDLFIFVTYSYYPACVGIREVYDKSILVPTAHDEPSIYIDIYRDVFKKCKAIMYLSEMEKRFVESLFHNKNVQNEVAAVEIEIPSNVDKFKLRKERGIDNYLIYVGRIEQAKGCHKLLEYFIKYKQENAGDLKLVLMGKSLLPIPEDEDIIYLGFVDEEEKLSGIAGAKALILPSIYESLSLSVLEAFSLGTPVIVNGKSEVLLDHCVKSNAGLYYEDYLEFEGCVRYMLTYAKEYEIMSNNAIRYIDQNYQWDVIDDKWRKLFECVES
jgi:glycosyltransferase involved in cell wall biosynthesis